eukprot:scaffold30433_cov26-Tisochrysis_lutea.AAC.6
MQSRTSAAHCMYHACASASVASTSSSAPSGPAPPACTTRCSIQLRRLSSMRPSWKKQRLRASVVATRTNGSSPASTRGMSASKSWRRCRRSRAIRAAPRAAACTQSAARSFARSLWRSSRSLCARASSACRSCWPERPRRLTLSLRSSNIDML